MLKGNPKFGGRINLRQKEFAYTGDFSQIRGRLITTSLGVITCLILLATLGIAKKYWKPDMLSFSVRSQKSVRRFLALKPLKYRCLLRH